VEIKLYDKSISKELCRSFVENNLIYGSGNEYKSLVTPSSTLLERSEVNEISKDLGELWELYHKWNKLYLLSIVGIAPEWIGEYSEFGMTRDEIEISRLSSVIGLEPTMCRVDYTRLGAKRSIAEIQWRSGGLGLFFGMQNIYSKVIPIEAGEESLGDVAENFYNIVKQFSSGGETVAVSLMREDWLKGEEYLVNLYQKMGMKYIPVSIDESDRRISESNGHFSVLDRKNEPHKIDFISGKNFTGSFSKKELIKLWQAILNREIWVESPLINHTYRQKWGLAFPFMDEYRGLFSNRLREIIIPTVLLNASELDLSPIVPYIEHPLSDKLLHVESIIQLADLSTSLRKCLVVKCGAGSGEFYVDGKGVFRLTGSRESARKTLRFVENRIKVNKEPWIIQQFVNQKYDLPVSLPWALDSTAMIDAHARFMIFGGRVGGKEPRVTGGLGNYGKHWKVSGRTPYLDENGTILGTAFNDIRVKCG
jgi:hypothetical protein